MSVMTVKKLKEILNTLDDTVVIQTKQYKNFEGENIDVDSFTFSKASYFDVELNKFIEAESLVLE